MTVPISFEHEVHMLRAEVKRLKVALEKEKDDRRFDNGDLIMKCEALKARVAELEAAPQDPCKSCARHPCPNGCQRERDYVSGIKRV